MKLTEAKFEGGKLILTADGEARKFVYNFKPADYEIVKKKKRRSLDANAYAWELCSLIASAVGITKEEVYRQAIREGNAYTSLKGDIDIFERVWTSRGLGWQVQKADDNTILAYYGSSIYDTKEMAALIDRLIQDAKALDLDVMSESERALLLQDWGQR